MLTAERENLAGLAARQVVGLFSSDPGEFYQDGLKRKLNLLLLTVDRVSAEASRPVVCSDIIPGFDLVVTRPQGAGKPERLAEDDAVDAAACASLDERCLQLLSQALDRAAEAPAQRGERVVVWESLDGTCYFGFKTVDRTRALEALGIVEADMINVSMTLEVVQ